MRWTNRQRAKRCARAVTLVELLVTVALIGLLAALLLPSLSSAREAARSVQCAHHLRQVGVGLQNYHVAYASFPPGGIEPRRTASDSGKRQFAWSAFLLPYIEESALFAQLDFDKAFDHADNAEAAARVIPTYLCPTVPRSDGIVRPNRSNETWARGATDYGGIYGERIRFPGGPPRQNDPPKGVMLYDRAIRIAEITDGTAHTLIVSEDGGWPDGQWINGRNVFDQAYAINYPPDPASGVFLENEIRSDHPHGANGLFCDGSVRFLESSMELRALAAICTRAEDDK